MILDITQEYSSEPEIDVKNCVEEQPIKKFPMSRNQRQITSQSLHKRVFEVYVTKHVQMIGASIQVGSMIRGGKICNRR